MQAHRIHEVIFHPPEVSSATANILEKWEFLFRLLVRRAEEMEEAAEEGKPAEERDGFPPYSFEVTPLISPFLSVPLIGEMFLVRRLDAGRRGGRRGRGLAQ